MEFNWSQDTEESDMASEDQDTDSCAADDEDDELHPVETDEYASGGFSVADSLEDNDDAIDACLLEGLQDGTNDCWLHGRQANISESLLGAEDPRIVFGEDPQNAVVHVHYADGTAEYAQEDMQGAVLVGGEEPQYAYVDPLDDADFQAVVEDLPEECRGLLRAAIASWGKAKEVRRENIQVSEENIQQTAVNLQLAGEIFKFVGEMFQFAAGNLELAAGNLQPKGGNLQDTDEDPQGAATNAEGELRPS
ncbi:uncharacterized protein LOC125945899 [Dermacentor silvarum]|uniref:uncharacterized protein LOC125945899 n=1 Tax=Dermacentor silvarum TaxID=543639 RepID=UPI002100ECD5|nr:uncharacterized protein LOC125945899 [Dermacentor silvarum]